MVNTLFMIDSLTKDCGRESANETRRVKRVSLRKTRLDCWVGSRRAM